MNNQIEKKIRKSNVKKTKSKKENKLRLLVLLKNKMVG